MSNSNDFFRPNGPGENVAGVTVLVITGLAIAVAVVGSARALLAESAAKSEVEVRGIETACGELGRAVADAGDLLAFRKAEFAYDEAGCGRSDSVGG